MIRIFAAFPIRDKIADSFLRMSRNNSHLENIRWTPKDNLHITLFFIGEVEEKNLEEIVVTLRSVFEKQESFSLEFKSIVFKGKKQSSMIWAEFGKNKLFSELSERIYHSVKEFMTIKNVHDDSIPHCTLARIKSGANTSLIDLKINSVQPLIKIDNAELWKTVQSKEGVRYKSLGKYNF